MNFFICQRQSTTQLSLWFIKVVRSDSSLPKNSKTLDSVENYFKVTATDQMNNSTYLLYDMKVRACAISFHLQGFPLLQKEYYKHEYFTGCGDENKLLNQFICDNLGRIIWG